MIRRSGPAMLAAAVLLTFTAPSMAQGDTSSVSFDGVSFSFDHSLGRSVNITQVPAQPMSDIQVGEPSPGHITFSLYPGMSEAKRPPRIWDVPGNVRVYPVSALDGYPLATRQLTGLQRILEERPDPGSIESSAVDAPAEVPYLPIEEAAQALVARVQYIDTAELAGIAYVTGFRQDVFPFARDDFWYSFQGLSTDGRWYVAVSWVLRAGMFPKRITQADAERLASSAGKWEGYIKRSVATLDAADPAVFKPSLNTLDDLVRSMDFASVVPMSPSPSIPIETSPSAAAPSASAPPASLAPAASTSVVP